MHPTLEDRTTLICRGINLVRTFCEYCTSIDELKLFEVERKFLELLLHQFYFISTLYKQIF